jgi:hypothetical protein
MSQKKVKNCQISKQNGGQKSQNSCCFHGNNVSVLPAGEATKQQGGQQKSERK